jgi:hypothetical protein
MAGAAGDDALSVLAADQEGTLLEAGDYCDAGGLRGYVVGDASVWGGHEFVKHHVGRFDAFIELLSVGCVCS